MSSAPIPDDVPRDLLRGCRIAVTGAASGIGRTTALLVLASAGTSYDTGSVLGVDGRRAFH